MKKSLIAISIAAVASGTVNSAELFNDGNNQLSVGGQVLGAYYISDNKDTDGDHSNIQLSLNGKSKINDSLYAFGFYEIEGVNNDDDSDDDADDDFDIREAYLGIGSDYGELSYGRQYGALTLISNYTDIFEIFGNDGAGVWPDNFGTGRSDSVIKATTNFAGFNVHVSYQAENKEVASNDDGETNASSYGVALDYQLPFGFKLGVGYNEGDGAHDPSDSGDDQRLFISALSFTYEGIYAAALYSDGENWKSDGTEANTDYEGIEAVVTYQLTENFKPLLAYNKLEKDTGILKTDEQDYVLVGFEYNFNPQFKSIIEYKIDNKDSDDDDTLALGLLYSF